MNQLRTTNDTPWKTWTDARWILQQTEDIVRSVEQDESVRHIWKNGQRQMRLRIGQLTNEPSEISRISRQLHGLIHLNPLYKCPRDLYIALLYFLSKTILVQAELEVTAFKPAALALSALTFHLMTSPTLPGFAEIFFSQLVKRTGPWLVPCQVPTYDWDGRAWSGWPELMSIAGYRKATRVCSQADGLENDIDHMERVAGVMRLYFGILHYGMGQHNNIEIHPIFQLPRYWVWLARMLVQERLVNHAVGAELLYTALDVLGSQAKAIWGIQFVKILWLLYDGASPCRGFLGGPTPQGRAARARVRLTAERLLEVDSTDELSEGSSTQVEADAQMQFLSVPTCSLHLELTRAPFDPPTSFDLFF